MASIKTRGIILRRRAYGEADRILTILTPGMGKLTAIAKGVRRLSSKLGGHLELFYVVDWVLAEGRTWYVVSGAEVVESHQDISQSLDRVEQASYLARLVDRLAQEEQPQPKMYSLLLEAINGLVVMRSTLMLRLVEWQLLLAAGLQPELRMCSHCGGVLDPHRLGLCPDRGGALCPTCLQSEALHIPIQSETLKILRLFQRAPINLASRLQVLPAIEYELARVTAAFLGHALESKFVLPKSATLQS
jgi:DNA repair protein RecO (recombination protein O)